jgi:O-antigen ligase
MGSINFMVSGSPYESSHNIILDVFYRNGLLAIIGFIAMFLFLFFSFVRKRKNTDLTLFAIFIFLHFEILVNPFIYAAQTGWIYGLFLAILLNRRKLSSGQSLKEIRV